MSIRSILAEDPKLVTYRPSLRKLIPSVNGVILFQQILHWSYTVKGKFYKFAEPCNHALYKEGDSWQEEIGFSAKELRTALDSFAFKCGKKNRDELGDKYEEAKNNALVLYYTDASRVTWYVINEQVVENSLRGLYLINSHRAVTTNSQEEVINESARPAVTITETTTETTTKNKNTICSSRFVKPTSSEVEAYAKSIEFTVDGAYFIDYYESKGWKVGTSAMKDWQAAVRTWQRNAAGKVKTTTNDDYKDGMFNHK